MPTLSRPLCGMRGRLCALAAAALPAVVAAQAAPDAAPPEPPPRTVQGYVIGAALVDGRDPVGQSAQTSTLQPVWGAVGGAFSPVQRGRGHAVGELDARRWSTPG